MSNGRVQTSWKLSLQQRLRGTQKIFKKLSESAAGCTLLREVVVVRVSRRPEPVAAHPR
jgi:hypothetical protein